LGIFHHSMVFASHHFEHHDQNILLFDDNFGHTHHDHSDIEHEWESDNDFGFEKPNNKVKWKILALFTDKKNVKFNYSFNYFLDTKNLYKKDYPPYFFRPIKNYSYCDTVKIIKSNI
jgi:hypothetical protein